MITCRDMMREWGMGGSNLLMASHLSMEASFCKHNMLFHGRLFFNKNVGMLSSLSGVSR